MPVSESENRPFDPQPANAGEGQLVELFLSHQARLYGFIVSLVPNRADAEDLLQETGMLLHRRFHEFQPGTSFLAWACQIAKHKVLDLRKRRARNPVQFDSEFIEAIANHQTVQPGKSRVLDGALAQCLQKLSAKDRDLIERCYLRHATFKRVAEEINRPVDTVYKSLRRIRGWLLDCVTRTLAREDRE
jgi:RNA polymerase sigma-70 factor (ECF subfamily)